VEKLQTHTLMRIMGMTRVKCCNYFPANAKKLTSNGEFPNHNQFPTYYVQSNNWIISASDVFCGF